MKCSRLNLQERSKPKTNRTKEEKPRRFCQLRMVNPEHEEDPRWTDINERFYCNESESYVFNDTNERIHQDREDLVLSVQTLQFQGSVEQNTRPRTSFKFKKIPDGQSHRMFVKQLVNDSYREDAACSSILSDYGDDYTKYFTNNNQSTPSSSKSSIVLFCLNNNKCKENKSVQVDLRNNEPRQKSKIERGINMKKYTNKPYANDKLIDVTDDKKCEDTKITFRKSGKRKSLTISRAESPATVQVIRVDVVCNYSCSSTMSDYDDYKKESHVKEQESKENLISRSKKSYFADKYMLTNTVKTLDENISGGKVTLMCKTYKLTNRAKALLSRKQKDNAEQVRNKK